MKKKKMVFISIGVFISLLFVIGLSYAVWQMSFVQESQNEISTGCFKVLFTDKNHIRLSNAYPIVDEEGSKLVPYEFTIQNQCNTLASYNINLEILNSTTLENLDYIKVMLGEKNQKNLTTYNETPKTLEEATKAYTLETGFLKAQESKTFSLRLWLDENTPTKEEYMEKIFNSKITITTSYKEDKRGTLMAVNLNEADETTGAFWDAKDTIVKVVFEPELNPKETDLFWDISESQNQSVMSYLVPCTNEEKQNIILKIFSYNSQQEFTSIEELKEYFRKEGLSEEAINELIQSYEESIKNFKILYIQSNGGFIANENSSYLFSEFGNLIDIEGLEYLDTSKVTTMSDMFRACRNLQNLDISHFDTSKVTTMSDMFCACRNLQNLDLSHFDTANVTDMARMLATDQNYPDDGLITLNLSGWDTSNVTNMSGMFFGRNGLVDLDLSHFNTSKVTNMANMFYQCTHLQNLDVSHFDTANVTRMEDMFYSCDSLKALDLSSFDTRNVTNMSYMFGYNRNLTNINYGDDFIHKDGANIEEIFINCPANKPTHTSWNGLLS